MIISKGDIWLVNLNSIKRNNEIGKVRPVLVYQSNNLNHNDYPSTIIVPLSTDLIDDVEPIRMRIEKRDKLEKDSDIVITQIRAIDNSRFIEKLTTLDTNELDKINKLLFEVMD